MGELNKETLNDDEATSIHDEGEEKTRGNDVVIEVADLVPQKEGDGAFSPKSETLALLQEVPKNLTYGDQGTIHV